MDINYSNQAFESFLTDYRRIMDEDISESDTRSKVIDKLFIDVLGWHENNITREGHVNSGFYDYKFSLPNFVFVVEAKKQFVDFILPDISPKDNLIKLSIIYDQNKAVIDQLRNYLVDIGTAYGVITNGRQFIIGRFINENAKPWKNNYLLCFNGFEDVKNNYIKFYENLSFDNIVQNVGIKFLTQHKVNFSSTILSTLVDRDKHVDRNSLAISISAEIENIFGDIYNSIGDDDDELIKECFVENSETKKNRLELNGLFNDNPPDWDGVIKARNLESVSTQIDTEIKLPKVTLKEAPPKPIILVGSKGAGKTTFIKHLFKSQLPEDTLGTYPHVYIDLIKYHTGGDSILDVKRITSNIIKALNEDYSDLELYTLKVLKRIYFKEIRQNDEGIWKFYKDVNNDAYNDKLASFLEEKIKDSVQFLDSLSQYLIRERRMRLIIIIDNSDQFDDELQKNAFLYAASLNRSACCGVIISLREGYYYKWRNLPPFNAFQSNVYHITAPRYSEVLQRRIDYILKKIPLNDALIEGNISSGAKIEMNTETISEFLLGLKASIFNKKNTLLIDFLNHSTFPNTREGLRLFRLFLTSGYTDIDEYILRARYRNNKETLDTIPIHEFVKSIGLNNRLYYSSEYSAIDNIFRPIEDSNNHFIKFWILRLLVNNLDNFGHSKELVQVCEFINNLSLYGYKKNIIKKELEFLITKGFIDTDSILSDVILNDIQNDDINIRITAKGYYYIKEVICHFYYVDLVLQDTPIYKEDYFNSIKISFPLANEKGQRHIMQRVDSVNRFLEYLSSVEKYEPESLIQQFGGIVNYIRVNGLNSDIDRINKVPS